MHSLYSTNIITSHLVVHPLCSNTTLLRGILHMLLYSCTFLYIECTVFPSCYTFCELAACTASFSLFLFFSTSIFGYFHLKCLTSQYLEHLTSFTVSFLLILTLFFIPHLITLLNNTSNLFLEIGFLFSCSFLFLQLQTRYPNFSQLQHFLLSLSSNSTFSLVRVCC